MLVRNANAAPIEGVDLEGFALARARLAEGHVDVASIAGSLSLADPSAWYRVERGWLDRAAESEHVVAVLELLVEDRRAELAAARGAMRDPGPGGHRGATSISAASPHELPSFMRIEHRVTPQASTPQSAPAVPPVTPLFLSTEPHDFEHLRNGFLRGPTPFAGATAPERLAQIKQQALPPPDRPGASEPSTDETAMLTPSAVLRDIITAAPHPFRPAKATAPPRPPHLDPFAAVTAPLDLEHLGALRARGPTPFSGATTPERLAALKEEAAATSPPPSSTDGAHPDADETAMYTPSAAERAHFATLPFTTPRGPAAPARELTLDELASLAAQLQMRAGDAEVLARFGIKTPADLLAVRADQERRFAADPSLRKLFEERRAHFVSFMKKEPRR